MELGGGVVLLCIYIIRTYERMTAVTITRDPAAKRIRALSGPSNRRLEESCNGKVSGKGGDCIGASIPSVGTH